MTLEDFIAEFAAQFDDKEAASIGADTKYQELAEWGSLSMMLVIALIHSGFGKNVSADEIRGCDTVKDLYLHVSGES